MHTSSIGPKRVLHSSCGCRVQSWLALHWLAASDELVKSWRLSGRLLSASPAAAGAELASSWRLTLGLLALKWPAPGA